MISGIFGIVGPIPAGRIMSAVGERAAMIVSGCALAAVALAGFVVVNDSVAQGPSAWHRGGFVVVLVATVLCFQTWMLGRQAFMGTRLPVAIRAHGMSTLGGMMRIGQVIGPVVGAAVVMVAHEGYVFLVEASLFAVATALVALKLLPGDDLPRQRTRALGRSPVPPDPSPYSPGRPAIATMLLAGLGAAPLTMGRVNRPLILPLVGAALGLDGATISLIFGAAAFVEILMFVPAGTRMDRYGRAAVAVPCLVVTGLGYLLLAVLAPTLGATSRTGAIVAVALSALVVALGNGLGAGIIMTLGIDLSPERMRTRHLARWATITGVGALSGPGLVAAVTLAFPLTVAAVCTGVLCLAGGAWSARFLPTVTPPPARPSRGSATLGA